jgi:flagellin-like hook-associated protein FlgL
MKKSELKKILKPIIAECIRESLYEEGLLKSIVSQVVEGYSQGTTPIVETKAVSAPSNDKINEAKQMKEKLDSTKKQMLNAIGDSAYGGVNVFEGTTPMRSAEPAAGNVMEGVEPGDSGVDISKILNNNWGKLI